MSDSAPRISAEKLTDVELMRRACAMTMHGGRSRISLKRMYCCEHSPMRTQLFWIEMLDIPTFVSVHLVRHKIGVEHFVMSNRDDRGGDDRVDRLSPVNHAMLINAQSLVNLARKRLCSKSHVETMRTMEAIRQAIAAVDPDLAACMIAECDYRGGVCHELQPCGRAPAAD